MKREEAQQLIEQGVQELKEALAAGKSDRLLNYLDVMSRFPSYSFNNQMLIWLQAPDSTHVQGFHAWNKLKRTVKKGEKGIGIIAPMVYRKDKDASKGGTAESDEKSIRGFKVVHVFDVSQTEGEPLPEFARATGDVGDNIMAIESLIRSQGIVICYEEIPSGALGLSRKGDYCTMAKPCRKIFDGDESAKRAATPFTSNLRAGQTTTRLENTLLLK